MKHILTVTILLFSGTITLAGPNDRPLAIAVKQQREAKAGSFKMYTPVPNTDSKSNNRCRNPPRVKIIVTEVKK